MFVTPLNYEEYKGRDHYYRITGNDLIWLTNYLIIRIVVGFKTDFASIPRILWRWLPPKGTYSRAAVLHDFIYATGIVGRLYGEYLFWKAMKLDRVKLWKRVLFVTATVLFGWWVWYRWKRLRLRNPLLWSKRTGLACIWALEVPLQKLRPSCSRYRSCGSTNPKRRN